MPLPMYPNMNMYQGMYPNMNMLSDNMISDLNNKINNLEQRVNAIENVINKSYSNNYNTSNYQMM